MILKEISARAITLLDCEEAFVLYGTDASLRKHLPLKKWDRANVYNITGKYLFGIISKIRVLIGYLQKLVPTLNYVVKEGKVIENYGVIPYLFNRCNFFYRKGITTLVVPHVKKYMENNKEQYIRIPIFSFNGEFFSRLKEDVWVIAGIVRLGNSKNFVSMHIPHFGVLEANNINEKFLTPKNSALFKERLNTLIKFINIASMAYFNQKGRYITQKERIEELHEKEQMLRAISSDMLKKEKELRLKTNALDKVLKEKYDLQYQRDLLSSKVEAAYQLIDEIENETDAGLASISHTAKNLYTAQQLYLMTSTRTIAEYKDQIDEIISVFNLATKKYPKLDNYPFWKDLRQRILSFSDGFSELNNNNKLSSENIINILEYILAVLAFQRGKEYKSEGKYYSNLFTVLSHIERTHIDRFQRLGIAFKFSDHTNEQAVLLNKIYHFHLEKDVFINLIVNSIEALSDQKNKQIWIDVYLDKSDAEKQYYEIHYYDTGKGIPSEKKEDIFKGYSTKKTDDRIENKSEHGIGGKTIYKRVTDAGGSITEVGTPGKGAHFIMRFEKFTDPSKQLETIAKTNEAKYAEYDKDEAAHDMLLGKKMLIIDDDENIYNYISGIFSDSMSTMYAAGREEAFNIIYGNNIPDVITLDLDLKSAEKGEKLLFDLKTMGFTERIPVIIISGSNRAYDETMLLGLGATKVFQKPVKDKELREYVLNTLSAKHRQKTGSKR